MKNHNLLKMLKNFYKKIKKFCKKVFGKKSRSVKKVSKNKTARTNAAQNSEKETGKKREFDVPNCLRWKMLVLGCLNCPYMNYEKAALLDMPTKIACPRSTYNSLNSRANFQAKNVSERKFQMNDALNPQKKWKQILRPNRPDLCSERPNFEQKFKMDGRNGESTAPNCSKNSRLSCKDQQEDAPPTDEEKSLKAPAPSSPSSVAQNSGIEVPSSLADEKAPAPSSSSNAAQNSGIEVPSSLADEKVDAMQSNSENAEISAVSNSIKAEQNETASDESRKSLKIEELETAPAPSIPIKEAKDEKVGADFFLKKWRQIARPNQLMPSGDWRIWMLLAGRGFGKTRSAAEGIRQLVYSGNYRRIALIANTIQEAKQVMVEGESGLLKISDPDENLIYVPTRRQLVWSNGAIATLYGAENYEQLRGPQFDAAWIDEFAKFMHPRETFEQLSLSLRLGKDPKLLLTTTPRPLQFIRDLMARNDVVTVRGSSLENQANLSPTFLRQLEYLKGTRLEAQEIYAEIVEENRNTLWSWKDIEECYKSPPHFINDIIIGVDPAITSGNHSDETGIVVVGKDAHGKGYVLEDASMNAPPNVWAARVAELYKTYSAKKIVIETNAGGELLSNLLLSTDGNLNIKTVYARKSKVNRAKPIVVLYQKKMIFHAQQFRELEMQMATYEPGQKSPDRLDAMVWAMTELFGVRDTNFAVPNVFLV